MMLHLQNRPVRLRVTCLSGGVPLLLKIFPRFVDRRVKKTSNAISKKRQIYDCKNILMIKKMSISGPCVFSSWDIPNALMISSLKLYTGLSINDVNDDSKFVLKSTKY